MFTNKKIFIISLVLIITIVFIGLLFIIFRPTEKINTDESNVAEIMQDNIDIDSIQEINEITESKEQIEPRIFIGRQVEDYIEPTYLDNMGVKVQALTDEEYEEYLEDFIERNKERIAQKDAFQSNIIVLFEDDYYPESFKNYEWFKYSPENVRGIYLNDLIWISYALKTYYDGNVPYDYYISLEDIFNQIYIADSTSIYFAFEAQTHGERPLHIRIDRFNYKIRVEEGVKRKNLECEKVCCN